MWLTNRIGWSEHPRRARKRYRGILHRKIYNIWRGGQLREVVTALRLTGA